MLLDMTGNNFVLNIRTKHEGYAVSVYDANIQTCWTDGTVKIVIHGRRMSELTEPVLTSLAERKEE